MNSTPVILVICGSKNKISVSRQLAFELSSRLEHAGAICKVWDPRSHQLSVLEPQFHYKPQQNPEAIAQEFYTLASQADGFVFATPVYHNSFSGILKNIIDHLSISNVHYKPVMLLSHGGGRASHAVDQLRIVVRGLLGIALPTQVCTAREDFEDIDTDPSLSSTDIGLRLDRASSELLLFTNFLNLLRNSLAAR